MSEAGGLFAIVLLVYLAQCLLWVAPGTLVFSIGIRTTGARKKQGFIWNAFDLAGVMGNPLPPLPPLAVAEWPDFQLEPDRFCHTRREGAPLSILWEDLGVKVADSRLLCNGVPVLKGNEAQMARYAELLRQLVKLKRSRRERAIEEWLRKSADPKGPTETMTVFRRQSVGLRIVTNLEFFLVFLIVPLAFRSMGTRALWPALAALVAVAASITLEFWTLHRKFFPKAAFPGATGARFKSALTILLSPVAAVRACDIVSRDLLAGCHPLAAAAAILPREEFIHFAGEQLRAFRYTQTPGGWYQDKLQKALENLVRQKGIQPEHLMAPPKQEGNCVIYCPRCQAQYVKERVECADCGHPELVAFPSPAAKE